MSKTPPTSRLRPPRPACNIDARGRVLRLVSGLVTLIAGLALAAALLLGTLTGAGWWVLAIAAIVGGAFQVYEGWAGWCVLRAMGFRTPA